MKECGIMAKTMLNITANEVTLTDSDGKKYNSLPDILTRLSTLRSGTVVRVQNDKYQNVADEKLKAYYLLYNKYNGVKILYCNINNAVCTVIADSAVDNRKFVRKFTELMGRLYVLPGNNNRQAYKVDTVTNNQFAITDEGVVSLFGDTTSVQLQYQNCSGELVKQRWLSLVDAVELAASRRDVNTRAVVRTEKGTVLFIC